MDEGWFIKDHELKEIHQYLESVVNPILRPSIYNATLQSIISGLQRHRKKQLFLMEETPISVTEFIQLWWAKEDDVS